MEDTSREGLKNSMDTMEHNMEQNREDKYRITRFTNRKPRGSHKFWRGKGGARHWGKNRKRVEKNWAELRGPADVLVASCG